MIDIISMLDDIWLTQPKRIMLQSGEQGLTYPVFKVMVQDYVKQLSQWQATSVALLGDNTPQWLAIDCACQLLNISFLPLPHYFTEQQILHSLSEAGSHILLIENESNTYLLPKLTELIKLNTEHISGHSSEHSSEHSSDVNTELRTELRTEQKVTPINRVQYSTAEHNNISSITLLSQYHQFQVCRLSHKLTAHLPEQTAKITFTSGTTGSPKGVCLSQQQQWRVANEIKQHINTPLDKHLCLLPFAVLLENVAGVYASLLNGTTLLVVSLSQLGFKGSSTLNFADLISKINQLSPSSFITTPEILLGLIVAAEQGWQVPRCLTFVAVGGARVAEGLIERAINVGIPVFQGYGLSECCSVVSLNGPHANKTTTAGYVLPHHRIVIEQGEVIIYGDTFLGYASDINSWEQDRVATGDFGHLDVDGFLTITGRKKNTIISSFGRNINPEWVESELLCDPLFHQAFVFGDNQAFCCAGLRLNSYLLEQAVMKNTSMSKDKHLADEIKKSIDHINQRLPDYARITAWFVIDQPINTNSKLMTANGRIRRHLLTEHFQQQIDNIYQTNCA